METRCKMVKQKKGVSSSNARGNHDKEELSGSCKGLNCLEKLKAEKISDIV
jgi:hypothetical protein